MSAPRNLRNWLLAPLAIGLVSSVVVGSASGADSLAGSQGVDTTLPLTPSAVTVSGRGTFADLKVTVNQTASLANQAVSITWTGGEPTIIGPGRFGSNYLQILQCWGDDDGSVSGNPGPPAEQCVQGAVAGAPGFSSVGLPGGFASTRLVSRRGWKNFDASLGTEDPTTGNLFLPFRAVDGVEVPIPLNSAYQEGVPGSQFWLNPYFGITTTNEVVAAPTKLDGTGAELMEVLTGLQSSGLGCGQRSQRVPGAANKVPKCWIVVVPRGTPTDENAGTPFEINADQAGVSTSPVSPEAWKNRIAFPMEFNLVDSACSFAARDRRLSGNQIAGDAVASWQPLLCGQQGLPPFSYGVVNDALARQQLANASTGSAGMVIVSKPLPSVASTPSSPVVYAPLTLSGLTIGFNIERIPKQSAPEAAQSISGVRVAEINLTPRLVAKLLTQSYATQVTVYEAPEYDWLALNPSHLGNDPDFERFNPEFAQLEIGSPRRFGGLALPAGNSDAAEQVWEWILSDPEAKAWLAGQPDAWGMVVNPIYATTAATNSSGIPFGVPAPVSFPKGDPYCYQGPPVGPSNSITPPALCATEWVPYTASFREAAATTRQASDGARISQNTFPISVSDVWRRETPQTIGRRSFLSLTDTGSATRFGLQSASLSRAGDNGDDRQFVAPDAQSLLKGVSAMKAKSTAGFLEPIPFGTDSDVPAGSNAGAYPLTTLTYAAVKPLALDASARSDYASFVDFAVTGGQQPGVEPGRLPGGFVPLPPELVAQAAAAATSIRTVTAPLSPAPPPPPAPPAPGVVESAPEAPESVPGAPASTPEGSAPARSTAPTQAVPAPVAPTPPIAAADPVVDVPVGTPVVEAEVALGDEPVASKSRKSVATPLLAMGRSRYAVAGFGILSVLSLLGALEISKRPRRTKGVGTPGADVGGAT